MKKNNGIFERTEKKYILTEKQRKDFLEAASEKIREDLFGEHTISNIYYDTEEYELIRHSIEKPKYKEKFRIRGYGKIDNNSQVFLELKKKVQGIVYKRRVSMTHKQMEHYMKHGVQPDCEWQDRQILKEIQ